jgi:transcriptional regulator with XRE-family HTH domain
MIHTRLEDSVAEVTSFEGLGDRLCRLRRLKGLSKTDLAERLGVTVTSICYWEQGRSRPRLARLQQLAELLGTSPAELLSPETSPGGDHLADLVTRMRAEIAHAAGTTPSKVRIVIEI